MVFVQRYYIYATIGNRRAYRPYRRDEIGQTTSLNKNHRVGADRFLAHKTYNNHSIWMPKHKETSTVTGGSRIACSYTKRGGAGTDLRRRLLRGLGRRRKGTRRTAIKVAGEWGRTGGGAAPAFGGVAGEGEGRERGGGGRGRGFGSLVAAGRERQ